MRLVFVNHCHPETPHICATRMREFANAMTNRGHQVILLTETLMRKSSEISPEEVSETILQHNFEQPLYLSIGPKGHPLIQKLRERKLSWGIRQVVIVWYFLRYKGVFSDWSLGCQEYLYPISESFEPDLVWATFLNTDSWNIALNLANISGIPWVADLKDSWGNFIPLIFRSFLARHFNSCIGISAFSEFNLNDAAKWFRNKPRNVIYSGFWERQLNDPTPVSKATIDICLTGGIYSSDSLRKLILGVKNWIEKLPDDKKNKVRLIYAGNDVEVVRKTSFLLNGICQVILRRFLPVAELHTIYRDTIANLYVKSDTTFHHKTIEMLSAGRPIVCYPEESIEAIRIAKSTKIDLYSCKSVQEVSEALSECLITKTRNLRQNEELRNFTWEFQAKKLEHFFLSVVANKEN